jgi:hypothetical protein
MEDGGPMMLRYGIAIAALLPLAFVACGGNSTSNDARPAAGSGGTGGTAGSGGTATSGGSGTTGGTGTGGTISSGGLNTGGTGTGGAGSGGAAGAATGGSGGASSGNGGTAGSAQAGSGPAGQGGVSTAGSAGVAGSELGGEGGGPTVECPAGCEPQPQGLCGMDAITWVCTGSPPWMEFQAAGCTDPGTQVPRYCCPDTYLPECQ